MSSRIKKKFKTKFFETLSLDDAVKIFEAHWRMDPGTVDKSMINMSMHIGAKVMRVKDPDSVSCKVFCYSVFFPCLRTGTMRLVIDHRIMSSDRVLAITHSLDGG